MGKTGLSVDTTNKTPNSEGRMTPAVVQLDKSAEPSGSGIGKTEMIVETTDDENLNLEHEERIDGAKRILDLGKDTIGETEALKKWTGLLSQNRQATDGMSLTFIPPVVIDGKQIIRIEEDEVLQQTKEWDKALVIYVVGDNPNFTYMSNYIARTWNNVAKPTLFLHDEGWYIVKFQRKNEKNEVLCWGPYTLNSKPLILKEWTPKLWLPAEFPQDNAIVG